MLSKRTNRHHYIDYLRGFMILYVVLDHSMHGYAPHFKRYWYIPDFGGSLLFDIWHMQNDAVMMPMLFFISGMFIFSSLKRRGFLDFSKEKFLRLVIPFCFGVFFIVPPQTYGKYITFTNPNISYFDYLDQIFFFKNFSLSAFWFLSLLFVLTYMMIVISWIAPFILKGFEKLASQLARNPIITCLCVFLILSIFLGISDLIWGAHWWISFSKLLFARGSRLFVKIFLFFLGAGIAQAGLLHNPEFQERLGRNWKRWTLLALAFGAAYMSYALLNFSEPGGPYNIEILRAIRQQASFADILALAQVYAPPILLRTTLLAGFMGSLIVFYFAIFYRFLNADHPYWQSLALCSFGIYIFHEPVTVWMNIYFFEDSLPVELKFLAVASVSLAVSWLLTYYLRRLPGIKHIL